MLEKSSFQINGESINLRSGDLTEKIKIKTTRTVVKIMIIAFLSEILFKI